MSKTQCFVIKRGTDFDKAVKKHFELKSKWDSIFDKVGAMLGENITKMAFSANRLIIDTNELEIESNKNLFKKDGELKTNSNKAKTILEKYKNIIKEEGLTEYEELPHINFRYGIYRTSGQEMESFVTSDHDIYYRTNFDLGKKSNKLVTPISEVEYQEVYLNELKKQKLNKDDRN